MSDEIDGSTLPEAVRHQLLGRMLERAMKSGSVIVLTSYDSVGEKRVLRLDDGEIQMTEIEAIAYRQTMGHP